jgi:outer membrane protein assembly factor BamB
MIKARVWMGTAALVLGALALPADAVSTKTWTTATYKEFDEGKGEHARVSSDGAVVPGDATRRVELETEAIWTAARAPDGTIYAGGVDDGTIYAVSGTSKRKVASLEKETPWIGALAVGADGMVYAGTLGSGAVHAMDPRSGKVTRLAKLEGASHVWSLVVDGRTLWAGTGPGGKLFAIELPGGKARVAWESEDKHLLSLARAADGGLWIGTSTEAILFRFDPKAGRARAIADFAGTEVKAIAVLPDGDAVVVAANEFEHKPGTAAPLMPAAKGPKGTAGKAPEAGSAPGADKTAAGEDGPPRTDARKGKGALFRVERDGRVEQLHALADTTFTSVATAEGGVVYAGAGGQGRVYQVRPDRSVVTAFDVPERQIHAVLTGKGGLAFATGDTASIYTATGQSRDARYTSKVFDAQVPSRWGNLRASGAGVGVETRSGNTAKPDKGWSGWEKLAAPVRGASDATIGRVASPPGRYLQYRVVFAGASAALREVTVYYLPQNQRARVTDVTIGEPDAKKAPVTTVAGATKPRSPIVKVKWKVDNGDDDELVYRLELRPEGDSEWRELFTGTEPLTATSFDWNTEAMPDGHYRLRVTASDRRVNPRDLALDHALVSAPFLVDNQKPEVQALEVRYPTVTGRAVDSFSRIDEIAYQIDGGEWIMAFPQDGIFDGLVEPFTFKLPSDLRPGPHTLTLRVADEADNIGAASAVFRIR